MQYQAELDRVDLDMYLQQLYFKHSEVIVAFLSADYARKEWTQLEGRVIREMIKRRDTGRLMFVRFDNAEVPGIFSIDGYVSALENDPQAVADLILDRLYAEREHGWAWGPSQYGRGCGFSWRRALNNSQRTAPSRGSAEPLARMGSQPR